MNKSISSNTDFQGQSTSSNTDNVIDSQIQPPSLNVQNQPSPSSLANKIITKKCKIIKLTFQQSWYAEFNLLHWDPTLEKLLCYHC